MQKGQLLSFFFILFICQFCLRINAQNEFKLLRTIYGENEGDKFSIVGSLGDVNNDGYNDFMVGSNPGGYTKLYFGGSPFVTFNCLRFESSEPYTIYGGSFAGNGDLNGDRITDFALGAAWDLYFFGKVFIHFGGAAVDTTADLTIEGQGYYYYFGSCMAMNGDVNGDGYDDLIASAPFDDYDARGRLYIYFGGADMDNIEDVYIEGQDGFDRFGASVSIIGDINNDGYDDFLVGAPQVGADKPGKAYLFFGGEEIGFNNCIEFVGTGSNFEYGAFTPGLGDINGDGINDFGISSGDHVDIFTGETLKKLFTISSSKEYWYPLNISGNYDLNKDGFDDFIVSYAHREDQYAGGVAVYLGGSNIDTLAAYTIAGNTRNSYFGTGLELGGDINNDGMPELFIGEPGELTQGGGIIGTGMIFIYSYTNVNEVENFSLLEQPTNYNVFPNYPNPFNPNTTVDYSLYKKLNVKITVVNIMGEEVIQLYDGIQNPGEHSITWDGRDKNNYDAASGIYFLRFTFYETGNRKNENQEIVKMILMR